ncbi:MAG: flagellar assembly protein FliW [Desulfobacterales bacterium]
MKIDTTRFGSIPVNKEKIIHMPYGMLGFPDKKQYIVLEHQENSPFFWYQSLDDPGLAFVITSPFLFIPNYRIDLNAMLKEMSWDTNGQNDVLQLYIVVNIPKGMPQGMTGNFIGPILINNHLNQAVQMVLSNSPYTHKFPLLKKN